MTERAEAPLDAVPETDEADSPRSFRGPVSGTKEAPVVLPPPEVPRRYPEPIIEGEDPAFSRLNGALLPPLESDDERRTVMKRLHDALAAWRGGPS